jgi:hypothetical protein
MSFTFAKYGWLAVCGVAMTATVIALLVHLNVFRVGGRSEFPGSKSQSS